MRIYLLHYSCPPVVGGVEEVVHQQTNLFHRYFRTVKVFSVSGKQLNSYIPVEINLLLGSRNPKILHTHEKLLAKGNTSLLDKYTLQKYQY